MKTRVALAVVSCTAAASSSRGVTSAPAIGSTDYASAPAIGNTDYAEVRDYVALHHADVFRNASGELQYPYLVPAGPYEQCWDWDSVFTGIALLDFGSAPYLAGSMKNFFGKHSSSALVAAPHVHIPPPPPAQPPPTFQLATSLSAWTLPTHTHRARA